MVEPGPEIHVVLFDADGVVQRMHSAWREGVERMCGDPDRADSFIEEVFEAEDQCLTGDGDFELVLSAVLEKWSSQVNIAEALRIWTMIEPDEGVFDIVRKLRGRGTVVALATNQQRHRANHMIDTLGYINEFDHIFCSCHLGHAKPSTEYFKVALASLELPANQVLFIDDHDRNIAAAKDAGLHGLRFHVDDGAAALQGLLQGYRILPE